MKNKNLIVTGGCGFIGSHIVDGLVKKNYNVIVIDNLSAENEKFYFNPKAQYLNSNIIDPDIESHFNDIDCVFHLAAESRIGRCFDQPQLALETNAKGTLNILEICRNKGIKKIIYSSTSSVYGLTEEMPIVEETKIDCLNAYSTTKYFGEKLIELYSKLYEINYTIFRYFNVYGERSPVFGPYAPVLGIFLKQLSNGQNLTIVGDGEQRRDFIHVKDVAGANMHVYENNVFLNDVMNVGYGENISINELANFLSNEPKVYLEKRPGEARNTLADITKILKIGWKPTINLKEYVDAIMAC